MSESTLAALIAHKQDILISDVMARCHCTRQCAIAELIAEEWIYINAVRRICAHKGV